MVLDGIVMVLAWILNPRARRRREREGKPDIESSTDMIPGRTSTESVPKGRPDGEMGQTDQTSHPSGDAITRNVSIGQKVRAEARKELAPVSKQQGEDDVRIDPIGAAIRHRS